MNSLNCEINTCAAESTAHRHMPEEDRLWRPVNNLEVSSEGRELADTIIRSYDGLTLEQRKAVEASKLGFYALYETEAVLAPSV